MRVSALLGGGDVGGDKIAVLAVAQQQRRVLSGGNKAVRHVGAENAQSICALDAVKNLIYGAEEISAEKIVILQKLRDDLGIGIGAEMHAARNQEVFDFNVIFDNAVVNEGNFALLAHVGMRVYIVRLAVGRPAGVPYADKALNAFAAVYHGA